MLRKINSARKLFIIEFYIFVFIVIVLNIIFINNLIFIICLDSLFLISIPIFLRTLQNIKNRIKRKYNKIKKI